MNAIEVGVKCIQRGADLNDLDGTVWFEYQPEGNPERPWLARNIPFLIELANPGTVYRFAHEGDVKERIESGELVLF